MSADTIPRIPGPHPDPHRPTSFVVGVLVVVLFLVMPVSVRGVAGP